MEKIKVNTHSKKYKIVIGNDIFIDELNKYIAKHNYQSIFILIDENVDKFHQAKFNELHFSFIKIINPSGEKAKSFQNLQKILSKLIENKATRKSLLINVGGGVTGDVGAFAGAIFMRGIDVVQVPTTLLSMVDSSVGGKTGINFKGVKNIIGAFYQPNKVIIDLSFLQTLGKSEIYSGFGEIYKSSLLSSKEFNNFVLENYQKIINLEYDYLLKAIINSVNLKKEIVEQDEFEISGERKLLNLGHTFGHALESVEKFQIPHGVCVIIGILFILYIAKQENKVSDNLYEQQTSLIKKILMELNIKHLNNKNYLNYMLKDKKNTKNNNIKFVLFKNFSDIDKDFEINNKKLLVFLKNFIDFFNNNLLNWVF